LFAPRVSLSKFSRVLQYADHTSMQCLKSILVNAGVICRSKDGYPSIFSWKRIVRF
jgi:hypothetical protein